MTTNTTTSDQHVLFLQDLVREARPNNLLQIGMGNHFHTSAICQVIQDFDEASLTVVAPPEYQEHRINQLDSLKKEKLERSQWPVELVEIESDKVLPDFYFQQRTLDFAIINEQRRFDQGMVALYYIDKMLLHSGIIIIVNAHRPVMRRLCRYLAMDCGYTARLPGAQDKSAGLFIRKLLKDRFDKTPALLRERITSLFNPELLVSDEELGIEGELMAFSKPSHEHVSLDEMAFEEQLNMDFDTLLQTIMNEDEDA